MFSWSKKTNQKKKSRRGSAGNSVLNEFGIPVSQGPDNDEELEAELRAMTGVMTIEDEPELNDEGSDVEAELMKIIGVTKSKKKNRKSQRTNEDQDASELNVSVDISDVNDEDIADDEDVDVDENDPELLGELMDLTEEIEDEEDEEADDDPSSEEKPQAEKVVTVTSVLVERLNMYKEAEAKAKANNESARARRFARGIKTLQQLIKKAEAGQPVLPSDIPPVIATNLKPAPPPAPLPDSPSNPETEEIRNFTEPGDDIPAQTDNLPEDTKSEGAPEEGNDAAIPVQRNKPEQGTNERVEATPAIGENPWMSLLRSRREEYKAVALKAKRDNDLDTALKYVKKLNELIAVVELGEEVDESEIPPSLGQPKRSPPPAPPTTETVTPLKFEAPEDIEEYEIPKTTLEALIQRLGIYKRFEERAKRMGDEAGSRRNSKTVQIYMEAIRLHKSGKKVPLAKLPTPPGCPPIPIPFEVD